MSATAPEPAPADLALILANVARAQEETAKFVAEQRKLIAEASKLDHERDKLRAEALKLDRERSLAPWLVGAGVLGGIVTLATLLMRALGAIT